MSSHENCEYCKNYQWPDPNDISEDTLTKLVEDIRNHMDLKRTRGAANYAINISSDSGWSEAIEKVHAKRKEREKNERIQS